jgi:hypothetical protein
MMCRYCQYEFCWGCRKEYVPSSNHIRCFYCDRSPWIFRIWVTLCVIFTAMIASVIFSALIANTPLALSRPIHGQFAGTVGLAATIYYSHNYRLPWFNLETGINLAVGTSISYFLAKLEMAHDLNRIGTFIWNWCPSPPSPPLPPLPPLPPPESNLSCPVNTNASSFH